MAERGGGARDLGHGADQITLLELEKIGRDAAATAAPSPFATSFEGSCSKVRPITEATWSVCRADAGRRSRPTVIRLWTVSGIASSPGEPSGPLGGFAVDQCPRDLLDEERIALGLGEDPLPDLLGDRPDGHELVEQLPVLLVRERLELEQRRPAAELGPDLLLKQP